MVQGLTQLGGFILIVALTFGPLVILIELLNRRDRRQSLLLAAVLRQFDSPDYRGRVAAQVRCGIFSGSSVVRVSMLAWSRDEIWDAITRLSQVLPPQIRVVVEGTLDPRSPFPFTVETKGWRPLLTPYRPSVAPG